MNKKQTPRFPDDLEKELSTYYATPEPDPRFVSRLADGLRAKFKEKEQRNTLRKSRMTFAWGLGLAFATVMIVLLVISPTIVTAVKQMFGYIPEIGQMDVSSPLRVLAKPVSYTQDGITVTVREAMLSSDKTVIRFTVDNIPLDKAHDITKCDPRWGALKLPDGHFLQTIGGHYLDSWDSGFEARVTFEPVSASVNETAFIPPCIQQDLTGAFPEQWELPLHFAPAPQEMTVVPVIEVTPSQEVSSETPWVLKKVIETEKGYILVGEFRSNSLPPDAIAVQFAKWPKITDANGQEIPFTFANYEFDLPFEEKQRGVFPWAFEFVGKSFHWPLNLTADSLAVEYEDAQAQFEFGTGSNPQDGQSWDLDIDFELAGYPVQVVRAIRRSDGYEFYFKSPQIFHGIHLQVGDSTQGLTGMDGVGEFSSSIKFADEIPVGKLAVLVSRPIVQLPGLWQLQWQPENEAALPATAQPSQVCLTKETWHAALANRALIPALSGKVFVEDTIHSDTGDIFIASIANLDGSNKQTIGEANYGFSPSPDGSEVVYAGDDGLYVKGITSERSHHIPNTTTGDGFPVWSPDGTHIAFQRDMELALYIINSDGTGLLRVDRGAEYEKLLGWSPDSKELFYSVYTREGTLLRKMDLALGTETELFNAGANGGVFEATSADGREITFFQNITDLENGVHISNLDGSNRKLVAQLDVNDGYFDHPVWSPDGDWLVLKMDSNTTNMTPIEAGMALVNLDTCQIIPLPLTGRIVSWTP